VNCEKVLKSYIKKDNFESSIIVEPAPEQVIDNIYEKRIMTFKNKNDLHKFKEVFVDPNGNLIKLTKITDDFEPHYAWVLETNSNEEERKISLYCEIPGQIQISSENMSVNLNSGEKCNDLAFSLHKLERKFDENLEDILNSGLESENKSTILVDKLGGGRKVQKSTKLKLDDNFTVNSDAPVCTIKNGVAVFSFEGKYETDIDLDQYVLN